MNEITSIHTENLSAMAAQQNAAEEKFRSILDTTYDAVLLVISGRIEFANQSALKMFGYSKQELIGEAVEILMPERYRNAHGKVHHSFSESPSCRPMGKNIDLYALTKSGEEIPVDISLSPFSTERGIIVTTVIRNISDLKRVELQERFLAHTSEVLAETMDYEKRVQRISDLVADQMADWCLVHILENGKLLVKTVSQQDPDGAYPLSRLLGEVLSLRGDALFGASHVFQTGKAQLVEEIGEDALFHLQCDKENSLACSSLKPCSFISVPMEARGRFIGVISMGRRRPRRYNQADLAMAELVAARAGIAVDNARLYREAQNAIRQREDILGVVSHDLRNPLSHILLSTELLEKKFEKSADNPKVQEFAGRVKRSVKQMNRLIGDLLDFAKIQAGTFSVSLEACHVQELVESGIKAVQHHADAKHISLRYEPFEVISKAYCDEERIIQVFSNLLGNAIKFSPEGSEIVVRAFYSGDGVLFSVTDRGVGIPESDLSHIFDRYWQMKETAHLGHGLGLAISKGIIESHGGRIWAESKVGRGTTFFFTLPITKEILHS